MHSPLPWHIDKIDNENIKDAEGNYVLFSDMANAKDVEFIVKTVNEKYRGDI